jgi:hypothetical protein
MNVMCCFHSDGHNPLLGDAMNNFALTHRGTAIKQMRFWYVATGKVQ